MRRHIALMLFLLVTPPAFASAQSVAPAAAPADRILKVRVELKLDTAQMLKLRDLGRSQGTALARATSNYLRAEADLLEASRGSELGARRSAMEKRAKAAIEGEMVRLAAEKEARAVLTARQVDLLDIILTESEDASTRNRPIWDSQTAPLPLTAVPFAVADSETVRITVQPLTSEIFIDNRPAGFGRVMVHLPIGAHMLKFRSPSCVDTMTIAVAKGDRNPVAHRMSCGR
jgi:hypothetical protein